MSRAWLQVWRPYTRDERFDGDAEKPFRSGIYTVLNSYRSCSAEIYFTLNWINSSGWYILLFYVLNEKDAGRPSYKGVYTSRVRLTLIYKKGGGDHTDRSAQIFDQLKNVGGWAWLWTLRPKRLWIDRDTIEEQPLTSVEWDEVTVKEKITHESIRQPGQAETKG